MTIRFSVPGIEDPALKDAPSETEAFHDAGFKVEVKGAVRVAETRAATLTELEADEDDVVELTFDDGVVFCVPAAVLREDLSPAAPDRGAGDGAPPLLLPPRFAFGMQSRGVGDWVLRAARVFGVQVAADVVAAQLVAKVEGKLDQVGPGPGLYRWNTPVQLGPVINGQLPNDGPSLVFVHGTASHTQGSFGGLTESGNAAIWAEIQKLYGGRVFALEHRTLSQSPVENALEIAQHLPKGARLHLVTHSRGGLVGELLSRAGFPGAFDSKDLGQFDGAEQQRLRDLGKLLTGKGVRVDRFVRVACPARGTTLASRRLDRYLSLILNCIGLIPALAGSPLYGWVKSLLVAIAKKRADPEDLPGLEAQMPESRLVKILNRQDPGFAVDADLSVIAGDIEGAGVWQRLGVLATDLFYREDHDLVVNTWAMTGGGRRTPDGRARYAFDAGSEVNHFNYFRNSRTVGKLAAALRSEEDRQREFLPLPEKPQRLVERGPAIVGKPKPVLFLLPGIMGSQLAAASDRIWVELADIAQGKMDRLKIDRDDVRVDGMMPEYAAITHYLGASHEVVPFPFDWRRSVFEAAAELERAVKRQLERTDQPIRFLAHSMGGLVVRAMIAKYSETWAKAAGRPGMRFVMLGTPNQGSYVIPHILLGREPIFRHLALLDLTSSRNALAGLVGAFPGLLDMLPVDPQANVFADGWWDPLVGVLDQGWPKPRTDLLEGALKNRRKLDADGQPDPRYSIYVAGIAKETPWGVGLVGRNGSARLELRGTSRGDGRVTWASGIPAGVPTWYMEAVHGRLAYHPPAFLALQELLENGTTNRLSQQAPVLRSVETDFPLVDRGVDIFPDRDEVAAAALGFTSELPVAEVGPELEVSITLGHLAHARFPLLVGHYQNDGIYSAEAALDARLGRRLNRRYALGVYPGELNTSLVVLDPTLQPPGGCVVGLGEVGSLSPGELSKAVTQAALRFAAEIAERKDWPTPVGLSAVLIGSGEAGVTMQDSIASILRGVAEANRRLVETTGELRGAAIRHVELIELVEDVAVCAARVLRDLAPDPAKPDRQAILGITLKVVPGLRRVPGVRRRIPCGADEAWWRRLRIDEKPDGTLTFVSSTDRARTGETDQPTSPALAQRLIDRAVASTLWNPRGAHTLFSLLVPNALKSYAPDERNVVLQLDEKTARFPWELLADEAKAGREPFSVRAGVVRQLRTERFRARPITAPGAAALVIGDPKTRDLSPLAGAQAEAREVAQRLREDFEPVHLDRPSPEDVLDTLFAAPYRILHFAGHGQLTLPTQENERPLAGMVLDDGLLLTAREIRNLVALPDLVIINCCHVGAMGTDERLRLLQPPLFAASLATELIEMGVRAVVAAGWAVDDAAARTFALELYDRLLRGVTYGDAVLAARQTTYRAHPNSNTWGAYQCYGDPGFHLRLAKQRQRPPRSRFVDPCELLVELENLLASGRAISAESVRELLEGNEVWSNRADIAAATAKALLLAGAFNESAKRCLEALRADEGSLPFDVLETLIAAVEAGADATEVGNVGALLTELEWMEARAPAPSRRMQLAAHRAAYARTLKGKDLETELGRIEGLLKPLAESKGTSDAAGLLALAEIRVLRREQKKNRDRPAEVRRLLERARAGFTELASKDPARARPLAARLALLEQLVGGKALTLDDALLAGCAAEAANRALSGAIALAKHVLLNPPPRAGLSPARQRQRETWMRQLTELEARLRRARNG